MLEMLDNSLTSMLNLERYHGHFYNWYSNKLGEVLSPNYVSTVDSGNLAASLIVIQQALNQLPNKRWPDPVFWQGLRDTIDMIDEMLKDLGETQNQEKLYQILSRKLDGIQSKFPGKIPTDLAGWFSSLNMLHQPTKDLQNVNLTFLQEEFEDLKYSEWKDWLSRPFIQVNNQLSEIEEYFSKNGQDYIASGMKNPEKNLLKFNSPFAAKLEKAQSIAEICRQLIEEMDFELLYNEERELFSIGFNVGHAAQDKGTYDLLASEARLASFIAIAKGDVPPEHWFKLSRRLTSIDRNEILLSWSGTMFEYLMPLLFMARYDKTLLSNTYDHVVDWQKDYGQIRRQPWGFSESGYNILNLELHYQYRAFGVPGLGLRRGLAEDYVVAPYASMLALMVDPVDSLKNLQTIKKEGAYSTNGFYEALDYTPSRNNNNGDNNKAIVKMYMAHHQGMSMLAMANVLDNNKIQNLFHNHPLVQSCELLLQERIPRGIPVKEPRPIDVELEPAEEEKAKLHVDHSGIDDINDTPPRTHILSNGRYSTLVTHTGTGYSSYEDTMLTRWRPDVVRDAQGFFFYLRDVESNEFWSVGHQPVGRKPDRYDSWYHAGKVQMARVDNWIESFMEVCVSPEDDIELRKITLTNYSDRPREIEVTSYAETVLNDQQADMAHPAFSNLFIQTEYVREHHAILAKRRPREKGEEPIWLVHTIASEDIEESHELQIESDRKKFIGRNRTLKDPAAMDPGVQLSGSVGNVPDPIVSIRRTVTLQPGQKKDITFGLGRMASRDEAITMADRYDNPYATDRVFELASIYGQVELEHIGISGEQSHYFQKLAGYLLFNCEEFQASEDVIKRNRRSQSGLWVHGISGDVPILVYQIDDTKYIREVGLLLKAHALWRLKGLRVDLVFINDHPPSYVDELQEAIHQQIQLSTERQRYREKGGIFVLRADELSPDDRTLIETVAQLVLKGKLPNARAMGTSLSDPDHTDKETTYRPVELTENENNDSTGHSDLLFFNGYGGFTHNGKEYIIRVSSDKDSDKLNHPPAPWMNVITNSEFGFITTENGSDHTWSQNSRENKLTPWSNDTVTDPTGEALYIRDEENGLFWSPTPGPIPGANNYEIRHGFGYTICSSRVLNIDQRVTKWVAKDDPIKVIKLSLSNADLMPKKITLFRYLDWVLGVFREKTTRHVITDFDKGLQTIFARNYYNNEFAGRVAFAGLFTDDNVLKESYTGDRAEFIGRNHEMNNPRTLYRKEPLDERFGAGFESCAASEQTINLESGESRDFYYFLGEVVSAEEARQLIQKYRDTEIIEESLREVQAFWDEKLTRIQVDTPVSEYDVLVNGWLQYQNIACRMWGRTGFYQSGGAFGFRDQLQDASAACYLDPDLSRKQILLHAAHQFPEGDVLHWWHPPTDRGVRSRISDDLLWLPYVTSFYVNQTGDETILKEQVPFVTARQLQEQEHEAYLHPQTTEETAMLYEHCCRAIDRSLTSGAHGLPLIGSGDWNDGMNKVGEQGKGESVWLGFFLYDILGSFIPICQKNGDHDRVRKYKDYRKNLKTHLNKEGWDGEWYRRAFYDDGTPLGSSQNRECKIDAIAQAWSIISGAAPPQKAQKAMESADKFLVSERDGIIRLLTPAFDQTPKNPGYIKGYIPGVRENGGQYTHAALWLIKALAEFGNRERAARLLQMLTPINHSRNIQRANRYSVEPYAVAADIYGEPPLTGMGGWTWYTGSAGWMYRVMLESILGVTIEKENTIVIKPFISPAWKIYRVKVRERKRNGEYNISISNPQKLSDGRLQVSIDGQEHSAKNGVVRVKMKQDGKLHKVEIVIQKSDE
jgi:cellobiose phosphorylase